MRRGLLLAIVAMSAVSPGLAEATQMDITAANIFLVPSDAVRLTLDGIAADPRHAPEITAVGVKVAPDQAVAIESAAVAAYPSRAEEIRLAVATDRTRREAGFAAMPREVVAPSSGEMITEPSAFARSWIGSWGAGNMNKPSGHESIGAVGVR